MLLLYHHYQVLIQQSCSVFIIVCTTTLVITSYLPFLDCCSNYSRCSWRSTTNSYINHECFCSCTRAISVIVIAGVSLYLLPLSLMNILQCTTIYHRSSSCCGSICNKIVMFDSITVIRRPRHYQIHLLARHCTRIIQL